MPVVLRMTARILMPTNCSCKITQDSRCTKEAFVANRAVTTVQSRFLRGEPSDCDYHRTWTTWEMLCRDSLWSKREDRTRSSVKEELLKAFRWITKWRFILTNCYSCFSELVQSIFQYMRGFILLVPAGVDGHAEQVQGEEEDGPHHAEPAG